MRILGPSGLRWLRVKYFKDEIYMEERPGKLLLHLRVQIDQSRFDEFERQVSTASGGRHFVTTAPPTLTLTLPPAPGRRFIAFKGPDWYQYLIIHEFESEKMLDSAEYLKTLAEE